MAAVAHESLAEDEILRRADELKKAVNDANTRDKIPGWCVKQHIGVSRGGTGVDEGG